MRKLAVLANSAASECSAGSSPRNGGQLTLPCARQNFRTDQVTGQL